MDTLAVEVDNTEISILKNEFPLIVSVTAMDDEEAKLLKGLEGAYIHLHGANYTKASALRRKARRSGHTTLPLDHISYSSLKVKKT